MDGDVLDPPPNRAAQAARPLQTKQTVKSLYGIKSDVALEKRIKEGIVPQPVIINGYRYWYADEVAACINNLPRGQGHKPVAALAARARQIARAKAAKLGKSDRNSNGPNSQGFMGPTPKYGFTRRD